ncbi:MAG: TatD family hydrolase [Anaerolineae bacterium]|nr:TatD family hydrolase [Anaerolineae bacterium]
MKLHDTHCHIDLYEDPLVIARQVERERIFTIAVTNLPTAYAEALPHVKSFRQVHLALGLHPLLAQHHTQKQKSLFRQYLSETSYIGEIGLDFSREGIDTKETQVASFRFVLELLSKHKKIVTLHSRRAEKEVLTLLGEYTVSPVIFHWYSGSASLIEKIVEAGHYLSVNPSMISGQSGQTIIRRIPQDRVLLETDGPFVKLKNRQVTPLDTPAICEHLSLVWNMTIADVEKNLQENLERLLRWSNDNLTK